ncbi:sialin-like [Periplaneta americana]|uniref:sialin-like n=1 Tax=Periplaneta americana TaxID=6978 RepID=UPI0037E7865F
MASKECLRTRDVLWILVFFGTGFNYMIRLNLNIAIVTMVEGYNDEKNLNSEVIQSGCFDGKININSNNTSHETEDVGNKKRFKWDEYQQGMVLGSFFWMYWAGQIPGGILSQKFGTKLVFGLSNLGLALFGFFIPLAASIDYRVLVALRMCQGLVGGLAWPSLHNLAGLWIPPNERSKFMTSYMGSSIGAALIYPMCGMLINWFDWPVVFYVTSSIGVVWFVSWWFTTYDSPDDHPKISEEERLYIKKSLGDSVTKKKPPTPWKKIIFSFPMWINLISQWGNLWGLFTLMTQAPTYFQFIHGWDIRMTGMFSGIPHVLRLIVAHIISTGCDYMLEHDKCSRTNVRKFAIAVCCLVQGLLILCLAFSGCNFILAIVLLTVATSSSGGEAAGALGHLVDLSPNYASVMCGISQTIAVIPGILSPLVVSFFTFENQTVGQWQKVFMVTSAVVAIPGFINLCFTTSDLQEWNSPKEQTQEFEKLRQTSPEAEEKSVSQDKLIICVDIKEQQEKDC